MTASQTIRLETELLILGTGAAGCGAALAARQAGIRTLMVDKGKLESSGCLGGGNDHFIAVLNTDEPQDLSLIHISRAGPWRSPSSSATVPSAPSPPTSSKARTCP